MKINMYVYLSGILKGVRSFGVITPDDAITLREIEIDDSIIPSEDEIKEVVQQHLSDQKAQRIERLKKEIEKLEAA